MMDTKCNILVKLLVVVNWPSRVCRQVEHVLPFQLICDIPSGKSARHCECALCLRNTKHKLTKIMEPLALFMLFPNNEKELMPHLVVGSSQHNREEVSGVGVAISTFWIMLPVVLTTMSWWCTVGAAGSCWVVLTKLISIKTKWCIYWDVIINNVQTACDALVMGIASLVRLVNKVPSSPRLGLLLSS